MHIGKRVVIPYANVGSAEDIRVSPPGHPPRINQH